MLKAWKTHDFHARDMETLSIPCNQHGSLTTFPYKKHGNLIIQISTYKVSMFLSWKPSRFHAKKHGNLIMQISMHLVSVEWNMETNLISMEGNWKSAWFPCTDFFHAMRHGNLLDFHTMRQGNLLDFHALRHRKNLTFINSLNTMEKGIENSVCSVNLFGSHL